MLFSSQVYRNHSTAGASLIPDGFFSDERGSRSESSRKGGFTGRMPGSSASAFNPFGRMPKQAGFARGLKIGGSNS